MAINKRKILQSAQKNLQKGAFDKALKDYKTLLEADPKDVNLRLKVGDVYLKQGKSDEAVAAYTKVAERFMKDGFDAKAVALYKQITKIDSKRVDVYVPLAELYQRLGLISDAMTALQTAADAHYREGDKPAALELLRKMATLDPANTTNRLKVAELLRQEGMTPEALSEFEAVADELERQEEIEGRVSVLLKILELEPGQGKALQGLARGYLAQRKWSQAEEIAQQLIGEIAEFSVEGYEILVEAVEGLGREEELPTLYQSMAQALRERGDEDRARELVQRYCGGGALSADGEELPQLESPEESAAFDAAVGGDGAFGDDELDDPGFVTDSGLRLGSVSVERDAIDGRRRAAGGPEASNRDMPLPPLDGETDAPAGDEGGTEETDTPVPEGDPEQLVAEASVYLRYGKSERAVESLRAALAQEPAHLVALEKLGEALEASGDPENAVRAWVRGAEAAAAAGDDALVTVLHGRIGELDPSAVPEAAAPPAPEEASAGAEIDAEDASGTLSDEDDIEIEIDEDSFEESEEDSEDEAAPGADDEALAAAEPEAPAAPEAADEDATEVELDDELELEDEWVGDDSSGEDALGDSATGEIEIELSSGEEAAAPEPEAEENPELDLESSEFLTDEPAEDVTDATDEPIFDEALSDELAAEAAAPAGGEAAETETEQPAFDTTQETDAPALDLADETDLPATDLAIETDPPVLDEALTDDLVTDTPVADEASLAPEPESAAADDEDVSSVAEEFAASLTDEFVTDEPADDGADSGDDEALDLAGLEDSADEIDLGDLDADDAEPAQPEPASAVAVEAPEAGSSTTPEQIVEELEEGEFYLEQGMLDEAAEVYERILAVAPSHPQAMVRLGEIEARRADEPSAAPTETAEPVADTPVETPDAPVETAATPDETADPVAESPVELDEIEAPEPPAAEQEASDSEPPADDDEITGELPASQAPAAPEATAEAEPVAAAAEETEAPSADESEETDPAPEDGGDFDLAAELSDVFDDDEPATDSRASAGTEEEGFEQVFAAFKAGVDQELGDSDHEARYDLGIAYKEMGLLDDAIGEFRVAMQDPQRQLQSLHMMGVCALDLGRGEDAVAHFEQALALPGIPEDQQMALRFDLGCAEVARGDRARARAAWEAVIAIDPDFQDVSERLAELDQEPEEAPEEEAAEEAFESFDDLISDSVTDEPAQEAEAPAEEYESFDDLMSDDESEAAEPEDDAEEVAAAEAADEAVELVEQEPVDPEEGADVTEVAEVMAEETAEPVVDEAPEDDASDAPDEPAAEADAPAAEPDPEPTPKKRRRKKISFM